MPSSRTRPHSPGASPGARLRPGRGPRVLRVLVPLGVGAAVVVLLDVVWGVPAVAGVLYAVMSLVTFVVYAVDKAAARHRRRRVAEKTLHLLALAGGWPGALVAQQTLRHKTIKASFRATFWCTVAGNLALLAVLCSPVAAPLLSVV